MRNVVSLEWLLLPGAAGSPRTSSTTLAIGLSWCCCKSSYVCCEPLETSANELFLNDSTADSTVEASLDVKRTELHVRVVRKRREARTAASRVIILERQALSRGRYCKEVTTESNSLIQTLLSQHRDPEFWCISPPVNPKRFVSRPSFVLSPLPLPKREFRLQSERNRMTYRLSDSSPTRLQLLPHASRLAER